MRKLLVIALLLAGCESKPQPANPNKPIGICVDQDGRQYRATYNSGIYTFVDDLGHRHAVVEGGSYLFRCY